MRKQIFYIWLQLAIGIANRVSREILHRFESIEDIYNCDDFSFLGEKRERYIKRLESKDTANAFEVMKRCEALGVSVTGYYDELYPKSLNNIESPPVALYSIGRFKNLNELACIAVVGTRKMTDYGKNIAESFAYNFAKSGAVVVSGLAKGVDTAAHRGAVMADGYTVAVLGNPIGDIYPPENEKAFYTLYERGLVISEMYPGCPRTRADFPNRNRIISGISHTVVVAEAGEGSGALITARWAINQGKSVFAVPGAIGAENAGTNSLIKIGVPVATEPYDIIAPISLEYPQSIRIYEPSVTANLRSYGNVINKRRKESEAAKVASEKQNEFPTEPEKLSGSASQKILSFISKSNKPLSADEISAATGIPISEVLTELTMMEIEGTVIAAVGGRYSAGKC